MATQGKSKKAAHAKQADDRTPDEMRGDILEAALAHVPFDGWSDAAIRKGARDLGLTTGYVSLAFPKGASDMVEFYLGQLDAEMTARLARKKLAEMRIRDRIRTAIEVRLDLNSAHKEAVRRTVTWLALPLNAALSARLVWRTADAMWRAVGDSSTDQNYYSKRMILSGVYASTLLVWLQDDSEDRAETMAFLERRIDDVMEFEKFKAEVRKIGERLPDVWKVLGKLRYPEARR